MTVNKELREALNSKYSNKKSLYEGEQAEILNDYILQKVGSLSGYTKVGKTYAYKVLDAENSPYKIRATIRWEVDWTVTRADVIDLTFAIELGIGQMLLPIWSYTFQDLESTSQIDDAFNEVPTLIKDLKDKIEF